MNKAIFISMFAILGLLYLTLGVYVSKKIKSVKDYFLAGRNLGLWALTFTLVATQIGGGMLLGSADAAYQDGYFGVFYSVGMTIGFLLLGLGLASKLRQLEVVTTAQLFETKYGSPFLRKVASTFSAISMTGIFAAQVVASRALFNALGIQSELFLILFWIFVVIYTVIGGLKAVVLTDVFQVVFLMLIVTGIFTYSISGDMAGVSTLTVGSETFSTFWTALSKQLPIMITAAIYPLFGQDLTQRFFAARTKRTAALGALLAGAVVIMFAFVPVYFGMKAKSMGLAIPVGTSVFYSVVGTLTNDFVLALVGCALIAAITSTADSLLCAVSSNIMQDLDIEFSSERRQLFFSKIGTLVAGAFGMGIAYFSKNILSVMAQSYSMLICSLFIPTLFCLSAKGRLSAAAAGGSMFAGAFTFSLFKIISWQDIFVSSELILVVVPLVVSLLGYFVGLQFDNFFKKRYSSCS